MISHIKANTVDFKMSGTLANSVKKLAVNGSQLALAVNGRAVVKWDDQWGDQCC